jgi:hypothetical protein
MNKKTTAQQSAKKLSRTPAPKTPRAKPKKSTKPDFAPVFSALCGLLAPYQKQMVLKSPSSDYYYLESREATNKGRPMFFAAVRAGKNYVSYHLMPVYGCPGLLKDASPELMKRMQGKACFNFTAVDRKLFTELARLTRAGYNKFKSLKYL